MRNLVVVMGALLLFAAPVATVKAAALQQGGQVSSDIQEVSDKVKGYACDCCQKCKAARRPAAAAPKEEDGRPVKSNGCKGCCERCGQKMAPDPADIPPEVIEKEVPPEVKDKPKR